METRNPTSRKRRSSMSSGFNGLRGAKKARRTPRLNTSARRSDAPTAVPARQGAPLHGRHSAPLLPGASFFSAGASTPSADDLADNLALRRADPAVQVDQNADDPKGDEAEQETAEQTVVVWREQTDPLSETVAADAEEEEEERSKRAASSWFVGSERLSGIWLIRPTARERLRDWVSEWAPFSLREQGWWRGLWRRSLTRVGMIAALACVVGLVGVIAFYVSLGSRAAANNLPSISSPTPGQSSLIISSATNITGATPTVPDYEIGVWSSDED